MPMSPRDRRLLVILGGVMVVAAAMYFLVLHKGSKPTNTAIPPVTSVQTGTPTPSPSPSPKGKHKEILVFSGRDPFCCAPSSSSSPATGSSPTPTVSPAGTPSSGPGGGSSETIGGHTVVLVDVFTANGQKQAQVEVDGTVYTVSAGDTFGGGFTLDSISGSCADFTFQGTSFTLCETANK